jgi:hypothetical protein
VIASVLKVLAPTLLYEVAEKFIPNPAEEIRAASEEQTFRGKDHALRLQALHKRRYRV